MHSKSIKIAHNRDKKNQRILKNPEEWTRYLLLLTHLNETNV